MVELVLLGVIAVCAKLWSDVGAMRGRLALIEGRIDQEGRTHLAHPSVLVRSHSPGPDDAMSWTGSDRFPAPWQPETPVSEDGAVEAVLERCWSDTAPTDTSAPARRVFGFEDLFGRRLPIWAGGVTLAVAGFLVVKYSIDTGLLSPVVRVVLGLIFATALIVAGEIALRHDEAVRDARVRQALAGAGIATLYASVLVAANLYHLVGPVTAFAGMTLTTLLAGGLSLRFGAPSALLGLVGGLAAPALVGAAAPDVPLLSAYLALTVGGLCALSRNRRWWWLSMSALIGGFGWSALLILGGALDPGASLSIGLLAMTLGVLLPAVAVTGRRQTAARLAGGLTACAQLAALVATGGFGMLDWGLFGLISAALVWLSRREVVPADLPAAGLTVATLLAVAWPHPAPGALAMVIAGITLIYGGPAAWRVWREDGRIGDATQIAAIALAVLLLPAWHLPLRDEEAAWLALLGAAVTAGVGALGWNNVTRREDARFAILTGTAAVLLAMAGVVVAPVWLAAPLIALVAAGLLLLAGVARDRRVEACAWALGAASLVAAAITSSASVLRAVDIGYGAGALTDAISWLVPAGVAALFARRGHGSRPAVAAQAVAVLCGYVAGAQVVPAAWLPVITAAMLAALALGRRTTPAIVAAATVMSGWVAAPLVSWLAAGGGALLGVPMLVTALPNGSEAVTRLMLPALAALMVALRQRDPRLHTVAAGAAVLLATVSAHIAYKQLFAIGGGAAFVRLGMAERTGWELLLAGLAVMAWRRWPAVAKVLAVASVAHLLVFTALLHDPLWSAQAVGPWPVANLLLPAYGTALALTWWAGRFGLPPLAVRLRGWVQMILIVLFVAATLRQLAHGSLLALGRTGAGEDIVRSVALIAVAIGFLRHGIAASARDWRIASLGLMLVAVVKVFLSDAAGLDGLLRIASFAALGFSLIGIGWLYSRYLPDAAGLTPASALPATQTGEN